MQHENGPGSSPERENNQELTQEDIELRDSIFDDEDSMAALRKVRPTMSLEDFNKLNHDQLSELAGDIAKRLESEKNHKQFLEAVQDYDFVLVSQSAQELGLDVRTVKQLNELDDFSIALIVDSLIRKHGRNGVGAESAAAEAGTTKTTEVDTTEAPKAGTTEAPETGAAESSDTSTEEANREQRRAEEMARAQSDVENIFRNAASSESARSADERAYRNNTIANLRINDAWLRDKAGVDPNSLSSMSSADLGKLFDRFVNEKGASYRPEGEQAQAEAEQTDDTQAEAAQRREDAEKREKQKKRKRFGMRVAAATLALGMLGGGIFAGFSSKKNAQPKNNAPETTVSMQVDDLDIKTSEDAFNELVGDVASDTAEENESIWDAADGNDARGLFANEAGDGINQDKTGEHNLVDDEEFANEDLSTEAGTKKFKEHFIKVNERQAVNMAMFADYMSIHGGQKYIPESIRDLTGEELEDAIVENRDGCYAELCKSYEDFINNAKVRKGSLEAGKYLNYYATQVNPDAPLTKDNIELIRQFTTFEAEGTPCFVFEDENGLVYTVKQECAQGVLEITGNPVTPPGAPSDTPVTPTNPPSTPVTPPNTPTNPPSTPVTPPKTPTNPPSTPVTPPNTPKNSPDDSKKEDELARGQGGYVTPVEQGEREVEDTTQQDYNPAYTVEEMPSSESLVANQDQAGDVNDTEAGAAQRQAREEAAAEQEQINQERNNDQAAQPNYDALNADSF